MFQRKHALLREKLERNCHYKKILMYEERMYNIVEEVTSKEMQSLLDYVNELEDILENELDYRPDY